MSVMNAHSLLFGAREATSYHQALQLDEAVRKKLRAADKEIRATLRAAVSSLREHSRLITLASSQFRRDHDDLDLDLRFLTQGSEAYDLAVEPAHLPPQQNDRDVGVYARTSFFKDHEPALAAAKYFEFVERTLQPLCDKRGWELQKKDTCVRVKLCERTHIDLPLYAVPDIEFVRLEKALHDATGMDSNVIATSLNSQLTRFRDIRLPSDQVMLAHRVDGWIVSDPRQIHDWFEDSVERYGPQLRRECRYLKGWRDFGFETDGPASIALMACVVDRYRMGDLRRHDDRDDLSLLAISGALPDLFRGTIKNPVLKDAPALNPWEDNERRSYVKAAEDLHAHLSSALSGLAHPDIVVDRFRAAFGARIPFRPDLVKAYQNAPERVAVVSSIAAPLPLIRRTTSG